MNMDQLKAIARERGIKPGRMKKAELIRTIQQAEANTPCFDTGQADSCGQSACLWREDCD
jgi:hypothetical protein